MKKKLPPLLLCIFLSSILHAQTIVTPSVMNAGGGSASISYYQYEWSIGETASIETFSSPSLIVTTGLLQPGTSAPAVVNTANFWSSEEIKVFPNPVVTKFEIDLLSNQSGKVSILLLDEAGRTMGKKEFEYYGNGRIEQWDMSAFSSGQYFLSIILVPNSGSVSKRGGFKIQKIK